MLERQKDVAKACTHLFHVETVSISHFTTGLGNEHPLENGFAFLNPYGLPYLPGSGVKGVVRHAAQELAEGMWGDTKGWSAEPVYTLMQGEGKLARPVLDERTKQPVKLSVIDVLLGREPPQGDSNAVRGALSFWDVIPQIEGESLMVEIMTPHQSHYYQIDKKKNPQPPHFQSPHDSGQPTPICFLTVPPGSTFTFHVICDEAHLVRLTRDHPDGVPDLLQKGDDAKPVWQTLLAAAFEHAFERLGFGAKTAVGYGAMRWQENGPEQASTESAETKLDETIWTQATLEFKANTGEVSAHFQGQKTAGVKGDLAQAILNRLKPEQLERLKKKKSLSGISVRVRKQGNLIELLGLAE